MKLSAQFFGLPADQYLPLAVQAEALGFEGIWLADHVVTPAVYEKNYPYAASGDPGYRSETPFIDVAVTLAHLAARTERIRLGAGVFVLPLRNPFHVARSWAALQNLSTGRAVLGIGAGWMREEFEAVGEDFASRGSRTEEMLDVLELLWSGAPVAYQGQHFTFPEVHFAGAPAEPVPLVFGGHSVAALGRAARRGSGWFGPNVDLEASLELIEEVESARRRCGRDTQTFTYHVRLVGDLTSTTVRRYADAGIEHLVFSPFTRPGVGSTLEARLAALEEVAAELGIG